MEVLRPQPEGPALSDEAVTNIFELIWRDTRMLARTAWQRPLPVAWELMRERVPIATWYVQRKADQLELALNEHLAVSQCLRRISPRAADDAAHHRRRLELRLEHSRTTLWPTLRTLLLTRAMHARVVDAARRQLSIFREEKRKQRGGGWMRAPQRLIVLWVAFLRWSVYGLRWVYVSMQPCGFGFLTSMEKQERLRRELIEDGVRKGLELQRRVERIEERPRSLAPSGMPEQPLLLLSSASKREQLLPLSSGWRRRELPVSRWGVDGRGSPSLSVVGLKFRAAALQGSRTGHHLRWLLGALARRFDQRRGGGGVMRSAATD